MLGRVIKAAAEKLRHRTNEATFSSCEEETADRSRPNGDTEQGGDLEVEEMTTETNSVTVTECPALSD